MRLPPRSTRTETLLPNTPLFRSALVRGRRGAAEDGGEPTATVSGEVTESVVGAGATVGEGAIGSRSVLLPGATVRAGAIVADSILGPRATIGRGAHIEAGTVLGDDVTVDDGAHLSGVRRPEAQS